MIAPYYADDHVTLYCADCLDVLPHLSPVDHAITDPPYDAHTHNKQRRGSATDGRGKQFGLSSTTISVERHVGFGFLSDAERDLVAQYLAGRVRRWSVIFCAMEQQSDWQDSLVEAGLEHVRFGIWHKPGSTPQFTGDRPGSVTEAIEIAHTPGRKRWNGGGGFGYWSVPIVKTQTGDRVHPTQKPLALMTHLILDFTEEGETILDPYAGSGTTLVAAKRLGRKAIGIERDAAHCAMAVERLAQGSLFGVPVQEPLFVE